MQMVTPVTPAERLAKVAGASQGFVYAVTMTGTTGHSVASSDPLTDYLERVRAAATVPVCAGFGIRTREQVEALRGKVDGVIVGSALVEMLERGGSPAEFLQSLRSGRPTPRTLHEHPDDRATLLGPAGLRQRRLLRRPLRESFARSAVACV